MPKFKRLKDPHRTTIVLSKKTVKKAKEAGLNLSAICEIALLKAVRQLSGKE